MSLETKKLEVLQQLLLVDDEAFLDHVLELLNANNEFVLSDKQKAELDAQKLRHERGEGSFSSLDDVIARIRKRPAASQS